MSEIKEYKCPCCGGAITFDSDLQKMKCPYCDTEFDIEAVESMNEDSGADADDNMKWETSAGGEWSADDEESVATYVCRSCGGTIVCEKTTAATSCPYCDNPVVITEQFAGLLKPDYVIPFKVDKKDAKEAYRNHLKGKRLLPKEFKDENHIDEIKGVYVPFWLFDAEADAKARYRATRIRSWSDSRYHYTETSYFSVYREGHIGFERIPVDGSEKMADDLMESIEPFDFSDAVDFKTAYLSGYLADRYDVDAEESVKRANARIKTSAEEMLRETVHGYSSVTTESTHIDLSDGKAKYALYPVWLLNTTWKDKKYLFAMNGQTGKFVGDLPVDRKAYWLWWLLFFAIFGVLAFFILGFFL